MAHSPTRRRKRRHREVTRREMFYALLCIASAFLVVLSVLAVFGTDPEQQKHLGAVCSKGLEWCFVALATIAGLRQTR